MQGNSGRIDQSFDYVNLPRRACPRREYVAERYLIVSEHHVPFSVTSEHRRSVRIAEDAIKPKLFLLGVSRQRDAAATHHAV
jgi:hypothetical protein